MDWLDLLAVQGTLKSLLQHHSSKASILRHSAFFTVQLSYLYMTTGKTIALTRWTFVDKVMSLLFNMLSRLVITFLPRSNAGDPGSIPGSRSSHGEGIGHLLLYSWASVVAQMVKNPPACRRPGFIIWIGKIPWRRAWQPTPVFLPGEPHGQRSLVGYSLWGHKQPGTTERLSTAHM